MLSSFHIIFAFFMLQIDQPGETIIILDILIPSYIRHGSTAQLVCIYDLEYDGLYSIKWYKDNIEFYSYTPRLRENPKRFYNVSGIDVDIRRTNESQVALRNISWTSAGNYKCQVSGEGPLFATEFQTKRLRVAVTPQDPPHIVGLLPNKLYDPGDWLHLNCSSKGSNPATRLTWLINGSDELERKMLVLRYPSTEIISNENLLSLPKGSLYESIVGIQFWIRKDYFLAGKLKVQCVARISDIYLEKSKVLIIGEYSEGPDKALSTTSFATGLPNRRTQMYPFFLLVLQQFMSIINNHFFCI
ncbi:uncharacterized protein [Lepeophtheirus salmonis]|nr:uncharacterized protein LOC121113802 [Lepeophtheirus salmonis]XP_040563599.1 uncharacterized protein LOC121113802 [Lepeophtheirus salmonis]